MVTERVVKVSVEWREGRAGMRADTVERMRDGDMMELQSANERRWKEKRRGSGRGWSRERLQSTSKAAVMKSRV